MSDHFTTLRSKGLNWSIYGTDPHWLTDRCRDWWLMMKRKTFLNYREYKNYFIYEMLCMIRYHLHNLQNVKNTHGGVLTLVKLQFWACNFINSNTPPWIFFMFFKLHKCYQIVQSVLYITHMIMKNSLGERNDRRKALSLIYSQHRCQTFSPPQISDKPRADFKTAQS